MGRDSEVEGEKKRWFFSPTFNSFKLFQSSVDHIEAGPIFIFVFAVFACLFIPFTVIWET